MFKRGPPELPATMRQSQTQLGRSVIDLTLDSDSEDAGLRKLQSLKGQTVAGRTTNMNSRRPNAIGVLGANLAGENRLSQMVVPKPLAIDLTQNGGPKPTLTNGSVSATTPQQDSLDRW